MTSDINIMPLKPFVVGISGGSGIGKSVLSRTLSRYLGDSQTSLISTDDLHTWERNDPNWEKYTHLNPSANNISLGVQQLADLKAGIPISRRIYDHDAGKHLPPTTIRPSRFIIHEGLHAFYGDKLSRLCDFKIFIETSDSLKRHWKILRDTQKRGYTVEQVLESINRRASDYEKYLTGQKRDADIVVFLSEKRKIKNEGSSKEIVEIKTKIFADINCRDDKFTSGLINFLKNDLHDLNEFVGTSKHAGIDKNLITDSGGNTSYKTANDKIFIKASGTRLEEMNYVSGYCVSSLTNMRSNVESILERHTGASGDHALYDLLRIGNTRASMESGFHVLLDQPAIIHTHPIYLLTILCSENSRELIDKIFSSVEYSYIAFQTPGFMLTKEIYEEKEIKRIVFLENHGLIVCSNSMRESHKISAQLNLAAMEYMKKNIDDFVEFKDFDKISVSRKNHLFPDSIVLSDESKHSKTMLAASYVESYVSHVGKPRYLGASAVAYIEDLKFELDRKNK